MEQTVFSEKMAGLTIDEVIRDYEFTMQTKHFHDSFELYFLLEGERYYFIDRETYHVKKGMVVLVNRQQIHKTSLAGKSYHDRILLQISQEGFSPLLEQAGLVERRRDPDDKRVTHLHLTPTAAERTLAVDALIGGYVEQALAGLSDGERGALGAAVGALHLLERGLHPSSAC